MEVTGDGVPEDDNDSDDDDNYSDDDDETAPDAGLRLSGQQPGLHLRAVHAEDGEAGGGDGVEPHVSVLMIIIVIMMIVIMMILIIVMTLPGCSPRSSCRW